MPDIKDINGIKYLLKDNRVFLSSKNINIFPCSRRGGQYKYETIEGNHTAEVTGYYDPEARLNTERTNRISSAINGFTDSFIEEEYDSNSKSLVFILAGYRVEVKNFDPSDIVSVLMSDDTKIYAHLSLHRNISLLDDDYVTEILYRQSDAEYDKNYLDVSYPNVTSEDDFFVGVSFIVDDDIADNNITDVFTPPHLPLFEYENNSWKLVQTSILPKIEHGETEDSIKISGNLGIKDNINVGNLTNEEKITTDNGGYIVAKNDIIARNDLKANNNISAGGDADITGELEVTGNTTVKTSLVVGERADEDSTEAGTITAKRLIKTPTLEATASIETPLLSIINDGEAQANIDNATITGELRVQNEGNAKLFAEAADITGSLRVTQGETELKKLTAENTELASLEVTGQSDLGNVGAKEIVANEIWLDTVDNNIIGQVPALELAHLTKTDTYQLRVKFGTPITIIEE